MLPKKADCLAMTSSLMMAAAGFPLAASSQQGFGCDNSKLMMAATHLLSLSGYADRE